MINIIKVEDDETLTTATVPAIRVITTGGDRWTGPVYEAGKENGEGPQRDYKSSFVIFRANVEFWNMWSKIRHRSIERMGKVYQNVGKLIFGEEAADSFIFQKLVVEYAEDLEDPTYFVGNWARPIEKERRK